MMGVNFLCSPKSAERPVGRLGDFFVMLSVVLYEVLTCWNLYSYIRVSSRHLSGLNYAGYENAQFLLNPLVHIADGYFPIVEERFYAEIMMAGGDRDVNFLLFSFLEIAILDFLLGSLMWYLLARILMGFMQRGGRR